MTRPNAKKGSGQHWVDIYVGKRIRNLRKAAGLSQEKLGQAVGVSFQQIQKYEKATNRVAVSALHEIARALGLQVGDFLPPMANSVGAVRKLLETTQTAAEADARKTIAGADARTST